MGQEIHRCQGVVAGVEQRVAAEEDVRLMVAPNHVARLLKALV